MSILSKIFIGNKNEATQAILQTYKEQGFSIINFLYFGNAMHQRVFETPHTQEQKSYTQALQVSDYLLADGIALQVFIKALTKKWAENLNGTDFVPYFIRKLIQNENVHIALRSVYDAKIGKSKKRLDKACQQFHDKFGQEIDYAWQCQYQKRDQGWNKSGHEKSLQKKNNSIRLLINCSGSPFQENRTKQNQKRIKENNLIIINAGGFVDFLSGFEKRAPKLIRKIRVGETFRRIACNPRKNFKKMARMFGIVRLPFTYKK